MGNATARVIDRAAEERVGPRPQPPGRRARRPVGRSDGHRRGLHPLGRHEIEATLRALAEDDTSSGPDAPGETLDEVFDDMGAGLPESLHGLSAYLRHGGSAAAMLLDGGDDPW